MLADSVLDFSSARGASAKSSLDNPERFDTQARLSDEPR